jgi:hypothetical protein
MPGLPLKTIFPCQLVTLLEWLANASCGEG